MIEKPTVLITSLGRTGGEFFEKLFPEIIPECTCLHEPDIFKFPDVNNRLVKYSQQILQRGIWRMVFLKAFGKWTVVKLSDARFLRKMDEAQAAKNLYAQRAGFVLEQPGKLYIETTPGFYGLIDIMPQVFRNHRALYVIRDGRDWVRSSVNWAEFYGKRGIRKLISHQWPIASDFPDDPLAANWGTLSAFEQLCWAWSRLNKYALSTISKNPHARVFQFEKIFSGPERYQYFNDMVEFLTDFAGIRAEKIEIADGRLEQKIHQSSNKFPGWQGWTAEQKSQFGKICGPLMEELGYKF